MTRELHDLELWNGPKCGIHGCENQRNKCLVGGYPHNHLHSGFNFALQFVRPFSFPVSFLFFFLRPHHKQDTSEVYSLSACGGFRHGSFFSSLSPCVSPMFKSRVMPFMGGRFSGLALHSNSSLSRQLELFDNTSSHFDTYGFNSMIRYKYVFPHTGPVSFY